MRINYTEKIGTEIETKKFGTYVIESYEGKDSKKIHWYTIKFLNSGNSYPVRYSNLNENLKDLKVLKADRVRDNAQKLRERSRLMRTNKRVYKKFDFSGKKVLSLDMSTTSTGWSLLSERTVLGFGSFSFYNGKSSAEIEAMRSSITTITYGYEDNVEKRLETMFRGISQLLERFKPEVVIFEGAYLGLNVNVLKQLMKLQGFVIGYCLMNDVKFECIEASSWQHYHNMSSNRDEIKAKSIALAEVIVKTKIIDDIADSINMGIYAIKNLKKI